MLSLDSGCSFPYTDGMGDSPAKAANTTKPESKPKPAVSSLKPAVSNPAETQLLNYVRGHSQQIVAAILFAASRAGDSQNWNQMSEYSSIAARISSLTGLGQQNAVNRPAALAAGAGS